MSLKAKKPEFENTLGHVLMTPSSGKKVANMFNTVLPYFAKESK